MNNTAENEFTDRQTFVVGHRVELHPGCDLWMRGAKFGVVRDVTGTTAKIKMDHPQVRNLVTIPFDRIRHARF